MLIVVRDLGKNWIDKYSIDWVIKNLLIVKSNKKKKVFK